MEKEFENTFCSYYAKSWADLRDVLSGLNDWVFRGQGDYSWKLSTSLERSASRSGYDTRATAEIEKVLLEKFRKRASSYLSRVPNNSRLLEWFSLIQHFGGPSRLLDLSHSFYVAIFFAVESTTTDAAVYCLNRKLIDRKGKEAEYRLGADSKFKFGTSAFCDHAITEGRLSPLVIIAEPDSYNERLAAQQGLFAVPFEIAQTFEYNLSLTLYPLRKDLPKVKAIREFSDIDDCALLKVRIPKSIHKEIRKDLSLMNITAATLYPGLDGFARSLHWSFDNQLTNEWIEFSNAVGRRMRGES
ncbi:FRG domain-containing protein [Rufibacter psychrotolerans]|uniref:FRG domain-containing protein n=1 Tax=Rufibacter psychrotolerans TaxID=2812556 RepID=UPI0019674262|nr:FRG domain-containing protein [Rufibacter sp. SYSU D00308]